MSSMTLKLNTGYEMPIIGLGTLEPKQSGIKEAVIEAIKAGYRHIDTAIAYNNELEIGEALKECIPKYVKREELFITTKLWINDYEEVENALTCSLKRLELDYVDLFLIHWPVYKKLNAKRDPSDYKNWNVARDAPAETLLYDKGWIVQTWKDLEECKSKGLCRSIGVSNFSISKIEKLLETAVVLPAVNQVEIHPSFSNKKLVDWCHGKGIQVMAFSPLGGIPDPTFKCNNPDELGNPVIVSIAKKHNKTSAEVILRWFIQRNICAIPKSTNKKRIIENFDVFDFKLSEDEMDKINTLDTDLRMYNGAFLVSGICDVSEIWK